MHIAFFAMSLNRGGSERVIVNLCNECLVKRHKVTIITCLSDDACFKLDGQIVHRKIDKNEIQRKQNKAQRFLRRRKGFEETVKKIHPDIIACFLPEPSFIALSLKKSFQIPLIVSERADPSLEYRALIYRIMIKVLYRNGDGFVFQTEDAKKYFDSGIQLKSVIIPNSLSPDAMRTPYMGERNKEIVAVGRLVSEKNYPMLFHAFQKIADDFPDYVLRIYGEGELYSDLEHLIAALGLKERIFLMGRKDHIFDLISQSALFVLSSAHEGMPNALMEAMALGLPVISTDCPCGGPRSLIRNGYNGILVENDNAEVMADGMRQILSDLDFAEELARNARGIAQMLNPEKINKQWEDYICKIAKKGT